MGRYTSGEADDPPVPRKIKVKPPNLGGFSVLELGLAARYLCLDNLAALQALGADAHAFAAGADFGAHGAQVHVPATLGHVVGVADVVSRLRLLAADSADLCHDFLPLKVKLRRTYRKGELRSVVCKTLILPEKRRFRQLRLGSFCLQPRLRAGHLL